MFALGEILPQTLERLEGDARRASEIPVVAELLAGRRLRRAAGLCPAAQPRGAECGPCSVSGRESGVGGLSTHSERWDWELRVLLWEGGPLVAVNLP